MRKGDGIFALICMGLSLWLILGALQLDYKSGFTPGPGFTPFWLGVFLAVIALFLLIDVLRGKDYEKEQKSQLPGRHALFRVGLIMVMMAALAYIMNYIGFILAVCLFVTATLFVLEGVRFLKSLYYGLMFSGSIFFVFRYLMNVDLPRGWVGL
jgi:putative tricarboxylic transport membrane protein